MLSSPPLKTFFSSTPLYALAIRDEVKQVEIRDRAFSAAEPFLWNAIHPEVPMLLSFRCQAKICLHRLLVKSLIF